MVEQDPTQYNANRLPAALLGFGVGVIGTLIVVAMNQERFNRTLNRTRDMAGHAHENVDRFAHDVSDKVTHAVASAKNSVHGAAERVKDVVDDVELHTRA